MKKVLLAVSCLFFMSHAWSAIEAQNWTTQEGMQVSYYKASEVPMVELRLAFRGGSAYDADSFGLSSLTASLIGDGTASLSTDAIAERYETVGAQFYAATDRDMVVFSLRSLSEKKAFQQALDTFAETIGRATFSEQGFKREQQRLLNEIAQTMESPDKVATNVFYKKLYGSHPYAHPVNGNHDTVEKLSLKEVQDFYQRFYTAPNGYLVIVGDLSAKEARSLSELMSGRLIKGGKAPLVASAKPLTKAENEQIPFPSSQTILRLGQLGVGYRLDNFYPLQVGNYILGGGSLVSRLALEVREKRGLTYGVHSEFKRLEGEGPFVIGLSTKTTQAGEALDITEQVMQNFIAKGPSKEELSAAKQYLIGSFPLGLASNRQIADVLLRMAYYGLPRDYLKKYQDNIGQVTMEQVKSSMRKHLNPKQMLLVRVGRA